MGKVGSFIFEAAQKLKRFALLMFTFSVESQKGGSTFSFLLKAMTQSSCTL